MTADSVSPSVQHWLQNSTLLTLTSRVSPWPYPFYIICALLQSSHFLFSLNKNLCNFKIAWITSALGVCGVRMVAVNAYDRNINKNDVPGKQEILQYIFLRFLICLWVIARCDDWAPYTFLICSVSLFQGGAVPCFMCPLSFFNVPGGRQKLVEIMMSWILDDCCRLRHSELDC